MTFTTNKNSLIDRLYDELEFLQKDHKYLLKQEDISQDVQKLKLKIDECRNHSQLALAYLQKHGQKTLDEIKCRLNAAVCEETRMVEESPSVAEISTGSTTHTTHEAAALACGASDKLEPALKQIKNK